MPSRSKANYSKMFNLATAARENGRKLLRVLMVGSHLGFGTYTTLRSWLILNPKKVRSAPGAS